MNCAFRDRNHTALLDVASGHQPQPGSKLAVHLAQCQACKSWTHGQSQLWDALGEWNPEPVTDAFNRQLYARISADESRRAASPLSWLLSLQRCPILVPSSVCLAAVALLVSWPPVPSLRVQPAHSVAMMNIDADGVEQTLDDLKLLRAVSSESTGEPRSL